MILFIIVTIILFLVFPPLGIASLLLGLLFFLIGALTGKSV